MTDPMAASRAGVSTPYGDDDRYEESGHRVPVLAVILVLLAVAAGVYGIFRGIRQHRTPPELRGDWWSQFEREFRAYASRNARPTRDRRRQRGETA